MTETISDIGVALMYTEDASLTDTAVYAISEVNAIIDRLRQAELERDVALRALGLSIGHVHALQYMVEARQQITAEREGK